MAATMAIRGNPDLTPIPKGRSGAGRPFIPD
jgi:hypothetical protein